MKYILLLISFFIVPFCYSQDWKLILIDGDDTFLYKPNTDKTAWVKKLSGKTQYENKTTFKLETVDGYSISLFKFDCKSKKMGILQDNIYSKDGELLESDSINEILVNMDYVIPDSVGEFLFNVFCEIE